MSSVTAVPRHPWTSRLATFRRLPWHDRWLFLEASFLMSLLGASLRVLSLRRVQKILGVPGSGSPNGTPMKGLPYNAEPVDVSRAFAVARVVDIAARYTLVSNTCLHRSLALWWLLERRGVHSQLRFGTRKTSAGDFEAHAWVKYGDRVLNDSQEVERDYMPLAWPAKYDA